jgi:poly(3-hydroxyalkanoate) synthetase
VTQTARIANGSAPGWATANDIILDTPAIRVRCFRPGSEDPYLIIPPQAGHHSCVADFEDGKSLVQTLLKHDARGVYAVEWKSCSWKRRNETIDDLVRQTEQASRCLGGKAQVIGLCQGGWVGAIFAALYPERVSKLILAASPIDFKAAGGKIQAWVESTPMLFYRWLVGTGFGLMRGQNLLFGFKMLNPCDRFFGDYVELFRNVQDEAFMKRWNHFRRWYEFTQDIAGAWYLQAVDRLFKHNDLIRGRLDVMGQAVDLSRIRCSTVLIGAARDDITLPDQVFNTRDHIGTPRENILELLIDRCGHIGVFIKPAALNNEWVRAINFRSPPWPLGYEFTDSSSSRIRSDR